MLFRSRVKSEVKISELPEKKLVTFSKNSTIGDVLNLMLQNNTRRLVLEKSTKFVNDRIILQKITEELKCLKETENFLQMPIEEFNIEDVTTVSNNLTIGEVSKKMYEMEHPCVMFGEKIITPWDICLILLSEKITDYE